MFNRGFNSVFILGGPLNLYVKLFWLLFWLVLNQSCTKLNNTPIKIREDGLKIEPDKEYEQEYWRKKWLEIATKGVSCQGFCLSGTPSKMPEIKGENELRFSGFFNENYVLLGVKGDGSCWIRSNAYAILATVLNNDVFFNYFLKKIEKLRKSFKPEWQFNQKKFSALISMLKNLSGQARFLAFNKKEIDKFLTDSFRFFLRGLDPDSEYFGSDLLSCHTSWQDNSVAAKLLQKYFFPPSFPRFWIQVNYFENKEPELTIEYQILKKDKNPGRGDLVHLVDMLKNARNLVLDPPNKVFKVQDFTFEKIKELQNLLFKKKPDLEARGLWRGWGNEFLEKLEDAAAILRQLHIDNLNRLNTIDVFRAFSYQSSKAHSNLLVHKRALSSFGLKNKLN
jgi:hypothetical protein